MKRILPILLIAVLALTLLTGFTSYRPIEKLGSEVINPTTSTALTVPAGTQHIFFSVRNAGIHMEIDGTAATTSDLYVPTGVFRWANDYQLLPNITIIDSSDGASTVYVLYVRNR